MWLLVVLASASNVARAASPSVEPIRIGEYGSLSGSEATFGISTRDAIELAVNEINAQGGVKGRPLEVIVYDDQGKSQEAANVVTRLITQDKVVAVLGEVASPRSLAAAPICQKYGVPMLTPSSTNRRVTEVGDAIFRACFIDPFQGSVMAKFAFDDLGARRVAVFSDARNAYSQGLTEYFIATFGKLGGRIVAHESYSSGDSNYKAQLIALRGFAPDIIYVPGFYTEGALIARQARSLGINVPLLGGDGWDSEALGQIAGAAIDGVYYSTHYSTDDARPAIRGFIERHKAVYGRVPDGLGALAYDALRLLADAIARIPGDEITPEKVKLELARTRDFAGVTGRITINAERNADKPAVVVKVDALGATHFAGVVSADDIATALTRAPPSLPPEPVHRFSFADLGQHLLEGMSLGASYALVALGYSLVYGVLGFINFAHAEVFMLGAFFALAVATRVAGFAGLVAGLLVAMIGAAIVALLIERLAYRPLERAHKLMVLISAIGASLFLQNGAQLVFGAAPRGFPLAVADVPLFAFGGVTLSRLAALGLALTFALLFLVARLVYHSRVGLGMRAVAYDRDLAGLMGVSATRIIILTFAVGGALAGAGGLVIAETYGVIRADMGTLWGIKAFVAAVIGGIGNVYGAVVGALLLGVAEELVVALLSSSLRDAIAFGLLILVLLIKPAGLFGRARREKV